MKVIYNRAGIFSHWGFCNPAEFGEIKPASVSVILVRPKAFFNNSLFQSHLALITLASCIWYSQVSRAVAAVSCHGGGVFSWLSGVFSWFSGVFLWLIGVFSWLSRVFSWLSGVLLWRRCLVVAWRFLVMAAVSCRGSALTRHECD